MITWLLVIMGLACAAPLLHRVLRGATHWVLAGVAAALTAYLASLVPEIACGGVRVPRWAWVPQFGLDLALRIDGWSVLMALIISGIGALILVYAGGYLAGHRQLGAMYAYLLLFMGSMLGVALSDNLILLFIFWELTSLSSYLLIGFEHERAEARAAALQALLVTGLGGLALLAGAVLLGLAAGTFEISALLSRGAEVRAHGFYTPIVVLVLLGALTKSAQFPFHFWLPNAMEAPTPVSAYLHSATMVKAGVFLLARMAPILGGSLVWETALVSVGAVTMLLGAAMATGSRTLKRILAYSTISVLGTLTMLIGVGTTSALQAAAAVLLAHALYKGALFMTAGALSHATGEYEAERLSGLGGSLRMTAAGGLLAALSMAGIPPLVGFAAKESYYGSALGGGSW